VSGGTSPAQTCRFAAAGEKARCPQSARKTLSSGRQSPWPAFLSPRVSFGVLLDASDLSVFF